MNKTLQVEGMTCGHCKMKVEQSLLSLEEVKAADVDLIEGSVEINLSSDLSNEKIAAVLKEAGYTVK